MIGVNNENISKLDDVKKKKIIFNEV